MLGRRPAKQSTVGWLRGLLPISIALIVGGALLAQANDRLGPPDSGVGVPQFEYDQPIRDSLAMGPRVDLVRVNKSARRLQLLSGNNLVAEYEIALGSEPVGPKRKQGDGRTPEGRYVIDRRKSDSDYHLALHISYPNAEDRRRARQRGDDPGGAIMIHGLPNGDGLIGSAHTLADWTEGCIAVTNREIEEIWERVLDGTPIEIGP